MKTSFILSAAESIRDAILDHESELESLDRAIGDGDHYINMKRGANAIVEMRLELESLTPDAALNKIGMKLLSTIGGASGPLLASFFISMAKILKEKADDSTHSYAAAFVAGVEAIQQRGKADLGEKTMLDVLIPVSKEFLSLSASNTHVKEICTALVHTAEQGMLSTKALIATKGRAASLGERAIGHIDPGAKSCQLMIEAVCKQLLLTPN
ncbi:dihydroxyacetone kinase subunit DhaL [Methylotenera sp. L2L1]|uniref:dihydroxyacetone kinase subunit DhaL n=1 Tax=Methylotenera sp. L2L1 TaxID=1502770 RepID=UPI00055B3523|nr:dihydroxyacetone kinase subunit DhaL [Methylotenera sp. L2L1]